MKLCMMNEIMSYFLKIILITEMNLLRESNMQLREENKHNFEECQKLHEIVQKARAKTENLESLLREREIDLKGYKHEIETLKMEKDHLHHKVFELLERCKNIDVEDYDRMKNLVRDIQATLVLHHRVLHAMLYGGFLVSSLTSYLICIIISIAILDIFIFFTALFFLFLFLLDIYFHEKMKFINELERHKEVLKRLSEEIKKLRLVIGNLPETSKIANEADDANPYTTSFRGIDNKVYYMLDNDRQLLNFSGCEL